MRISTLTTLLILTSSAYATPLKLPEVFTLSQKMRGEIVSEKVLSKKVAKLKDLERQLDATQKEYEKLNPREGDAAERKVLFFTVTFYPLFQAKKFTRENCEKIEHQVIFEDRMSKSETAPLTDEAQEALKWLKILCS